MDGRPALRFERHYPHGVERVWRAVTEPAEMEEWFPSAVVGDRAVGADLVFDDEAQRAAARSAGEPTRDDGPSITGRVVVYDPPKVFSFTWGGELLRFELHAEGDGTRLVFTQVLSHRSVAARNGAGWHACLGGLGRLLDAPSAEVDEADEGVGLYRRYVRSMGPEPGAPLRRLTCSRWLARARRSGPRRAVGQKASLSSRSSGSPRTMSKRSLQSGQR